MIKLSYGDVYEAARSLEQNLTFSAAEKVFSEHHLEFGGSVFTQLEEAFDYLMLCNQNPSQIGVGAH